MGVNEGVQLLCSSETYVKQADQGMPLHKQKTWPSFPHMRYKKKKSRRMPKGTNVSTIHFTAAVNTHGKSQFLLEWDYLFLPYCNNKIVH